MIKNIEDFKKMLNGSFMPPARKPDGNDSDADAEECESITATIASTSEGPAQLPAAQAVAESEITAPVDTTIAGTAAATESAATEAAPVPPATSEPVLTTFGAKNQVGLRFLRRSLYTSDSESISESQTPAASEAEALEKQQQEVKEISRRYLRRDKTKQRLERAIARASKTPEKETESTKVVAPDADEENIFVDVESQGEDEIVEVVSPVRDQSVSVSLQLQVKFLN